jgi:hypothetical protein
MTTDENQICKCGYKKEEHSDDGKMYKFMKINYVGDMKYAQICRKFTPKNNQSRQENPNSKDESVSRESVAISSLGAVPDTHTQNG